MRESLERCSTWHRSGPAAVGVALAALTMAGGPAVAQQDVLITFDHYHTLAEIEAYLSAVSREYADLATVIEIGRSRAGHRLLAVEINNPDTGAAVDKPGFYVDGNIHGGEVLGGEGALAFIDYLLTRYASDSTVRALVDTRAFYIVPIVNPDGRAISVDTPENHRWNIRPTDEDGDGVMDEDPPEDLDGDGRILQMRVHNPEGRWKISPDDPRGMVRREPGDSGGSYYDVWTEGIDNDGDGRFNEDRVGGVDLNRNFPANWSAAQFASGPYPLSEPESRALVEYITSHPNIAAIHTFHTSGGLLLRFPTLADQDWDYPEADLADYRAIADDGVAITGYENYAYEKQKIVNLMHPGHGVFNDWGSKVFGVLAMTTEMWGHAIGEGQAALFAWNDRVLGGSGFIDWYPWQHPDLGPVELGGWDRWSIASPPEAMIADEVDRNVRWVLTFAEKLPRLTMAEVIVTPAPRHQVELRTTVANAGWMPTATAYAAEVLKIAQPVRVELKLVNATIVRGVPMLDLGVMPGTRGRRPRGELVGWRVRITDPARPAEATIVLRSEKAGTIRRRVRLGPASAS